MGTITAHRLITAAIVLLGVSSITFILLHLVPGDPVEVMLGESASIADRAHLRAELGLDAPLIDQWLEFHRGLMTFDFGVSLYSKKPISALVAERIPWTFVLALASLGIEAGDRVALVMPSWPEFVISTFAVAKLGAVLVPLDPRLTAEDLRYTLRHSEAVAAITAEDLDDLDFYLELTEAGWRDLVENTKSNGGADRRHTLNTLDLTKENGLSQNATGDQLRADIFFRVNQSLQHFFNLSAQLDTVFE